MLPALEHHLYIVALIGLVAAYTIERFAVNATPVGTSFSIVSLTVAIALVGYSIATKQRHRDPTHHALFTIALGLHFFVSEESMSERLGPLYHRIGRYVVSTGALLGAALGALMDVDQTAVAVVLAFLAGGVILRTVRHELPGGGRRGRELRRILARRRGVHRHPARTPELIDAMHTFIATLSLIAFAAAPIIVGMPAVAARHLNDRWLSAVGGIGIAYVLLKLIPEVAEIQGAITGDPGTIDKAAIYLILVGIVLSYGVDRAENVYGATVGTAITSLTARSISGVIIGYAVTDYLNDIGPLIVFTIAVGFHYLAFDHELVHHFGTTYTRFGRWAISACVVLGALLGALDLTTGAWGLVAVALVAGAILYDAFRHEMPDLSRADFGAFSIAALLYGIVLILISH